MVKLMHDDAQSENERTQNENERVQSQNERGHSSYDRASCQSNGSQTQIGRVRIQNDRAQGQNKRAENQNDRAQTLDQRGENKDGRAQTAQNIARNREQKFLIIACIAVLTLTPETIHNQIYQGIDIGTRSAGERILYHVLLTIYCSNFAANALVYVIRLEKYRPTFKKLFIFHR